MTSPQFQTLPSTNLDIKYGALEQMWHDFFSVNTEELIYYFGSDRGYMLPSFTTDEINNLNTNDNIGRILFDSTNSVARVNLTGTFVEIATI